MIQLRLVGDVLQHYLTLTTPAILATRWAERKEPRVERHEERVSLSRIVTLLWVIHLFIWVPDGLALSDKVVEVRFAEIAPVIDGFIEEAWQGADSAYNFVQFSPYEKELPTEKTVVYVLQDKENLYLAFCCYAQTHKPVACLTSDEDHVAVGIDPFGSKSTAYYFLVFASEIIVDGWMLDDGRRTDDSWDGIWYRALRLYDDRYELEIKIPFKSIRYKKGLHEWGLQLMRYSASNRETDYWSEVSQLEGDMVSKWGTLRGINTKDTGYYFELYPEGFGRYDKCGGKGGKLKPRLSLNFKWDLSAQTTLNATVYPDFAQIESDPFSLNLSRYPTYLSERRPFFLEGKEIFRMSDFGEGKGFFKPLDIFYSRRIGKSIDGEVIPILGGLKLTNKSEDWNMGALGACTDGYSNGNSVIEHRRGFGVLRAKRRLLRNSDIGMLLSGTMVDGDDYNWGVGFDGVYRKGVNQFIFQSAVSGRNRKKGWAISSGYCGLLGDFLTMGSIEVVEDSFDVGDVGYVPWAGRKKFMLFSGPFKTYPKGFFKNLYTAGGIFAVQEPGDKDWSTLGYFILNPNFRNNWGFSLELTGGPYHEAGMSYSHRSISLSVWGNLAGQYVNFGSNYSYEYNYRRDFLAHQAAGWFRIGHSLIPQISLSLQSNVWAEWDTLNSIVALTTMATPRIDCRLNADISLGLFNEFVMEMPDTDFGKNTLLSNRIGVLFSWNFSPKSWLYIALNDYRERNGEGNLQLENQIGAIKAKYLMYF